MPKKSNEEVLHDKLVKGFKKAKMYACGKTFGIGEMEGYCAEFVIGNVVIEVITSISDSRLEKVARFKKAFGRRYTVFAFADDHMKDADMVGACDALYTVESLPLMISKIRELNKE